MLGSGERSYDQNNRTLLGDFPGDLKDVATERKDVRKAMIQVFPYWIDATNYDGFRIDTLKHVKYSFRKEFAPTSPKHAAKRGKKDFLMFGEAFDENDKLLATYTVNENSVDSVFPFLPKYAIEQAFKCAPGNTVPLCRGGHNGTSALYGWDEECKPLYPPRGYAAFIVAGGRTRVSYGFHKTKEMTRVQQTN